MISVLILFFVVHVFAQNNPPLPSIVNDYVADFRQDFDVRDPNRQDYRPLLANVVRLAFHYCVGDGGCDGCINMNQPDNAGLELSVDYLESKVDAWLAADLSKADLYALASMVAANMALGNAGWESDLSNFEIGRTDCGEPGAEESVFPDAHGEPFTFFNENFGFSPRETTVIMGAHTLGRALPGNSGFINFWSDDAEELGNGFYVAIERNPWDQIMVGNLNQWDQNRPGNQPNLMALNSDMYLVRDFDVDANGRVTQNGCRNNFNQCDDADTLPIVESFTNNQGEAQFQLEFKEVYTKMLRSAGQGFEQELTLICETFDCSTETDTPVTTQTTVVTEIEVTEIATEVTTSAVTVTQVSETATPETEGPIVGETLPPREDSDDGDNDLDQVPPPPQGPNNGNDGNGRPPRPPRGPDAQLPPPTQEEELGNVDQVDTNTDLPTDGIPSLPTDVPSDINMEGETTLSETVAPSEDENPLENGDTVPPVQNGGNNGRPRGGNGRQGRGRRGGRGRLLLN